MDHDYSKRDYLLPAGCKDLIDVIPVTEFWFVVTAHLPKLQSADIEITLEGRFLRIMVKKTSNHGPYRGTIEVPSGYDITRVQAAYLKDQLRIMVPKAQFS